MKKKQARLDRGPHRLDLYRLAVQHPPAEVSFLMRAYGHYHPQQQPTRLKEDFAGTCAVAAAWVGLDENHRALAVEAHGPTVRWARKWTKGLLAERAEDLHIVQADVMQMTRPQVDVVAALNFSTFIYHEREDLRGYFQVARRSLRKGGVLVVDAYGGPGAMRVGVQKRTVEAEADGAMGRFTYEWEQRSFDPVTQRTQCYIHFEFAGGQRVQSAFVYRWRLWTLKELCEVMIEAGFSRAEVWASGGPAPRSCASRSAKQRFAAQDESLRRTRAGVPGAGVPGAGVPGARFVPVKRMEAQEDYVAYVVGVR
jgi:SAM-dependent methyltransferase